MTKDFAGRLSDLKCCVIIPTFNNEKTLEEVIRGALAYTASIFVVNDGSTDCTSEVLKRFERLEIINLPVNKGKGAALRAGFRYAAQKGYNYAITIDSDGQHNPEEIPLFLDVIEGQAEVVIVGARNLKQENMSQKSGFANRFSNFWFRLIAGVALPDTQSGYRLYPLELVNDMKLISGRYEFELEVLVRAAWRGRKIVSIPVQAYYPPPEERVSHFRPFRDFARISILNTVLFFVAFFYVKPMKIIKRRKG